MILPTSLQNAIDKEISAFSLKSLTTATEELSLNYRKQDRKNQYTYMPSDLHRAAYINMRMPATYAAIDKVLSEIKKRCPDFAPKSLLDLGAGPGTVMWTASEHFETLQQITLLEQDRDLIVLGKNMAADNSVFGNAQWIAQDLRQSFDTTNHDLVVASYAFGELGESSLRKTVQTAWQKTNNILVVIEPGTHQGFADILKIRDLLIKLDAHIIAPCPHALTCSMIANPMTPDDWCHFAARLQRSAQHRHAKGGALNYEDEKFSYIVAGKFPAQPFDARIVRHPLQKSGHTILDLCVAEQRIERRTVSRRDKELYRQARKAEWGDEWPN